MLVEKQCRDYMIVKRNLLGFSLARMQVILCQMSRVPDPLAEIHLGEIQHH